MTECVIGIKLLWNDTDMYMKMMSIVMEIVDNNHNNNNNNMIITVKL